MLSEIVPQGVEGTIYEVYALLYEREGSQRLSLEKRFFCVFLLFDAMVGGDTTHHPANK